MSNAPCKDCQERHPGCHSDCEKYIAFQIVTEALRERKQRERTLEESLYRASRNYWKKRK